MPRNLARRAILLSVVRRYTYIVFGVIWAAFVRFSSCLFSLSTPSGALNRHQEVLKQAPALVLAAEALG